MVEEDDENEIDDEGRENEVYEEPKKKYGFKLPKFDYFHKSDEPQPRNPLYYTSKYTSAKGLDQSSIREGILMELKLLYEELAEEQSRKNPDKQTIDWITTQIKDLTEAAESHETVSTGTAKMEKTEEGKEEESFFSLDKKERRKRTLKRFGISTDEFE